MWYNSVAYTTVLKHEKISNNVAVQIFTKNGPLAFEAKYLEGESVDDYVKDIRYNEREEYSLGNDMDSYNLTPINENKSDNIQEDLFSKDGDTEDNVDNIDSVASPSAKGRGYSQVSKANTDEDDMESKELAKPEPMFEDLRRHFKRFI